jgi:APA family basic amino acid/polyamine antiporter
MGRKGDLPPLFGALSQAHTPAAAIVLAGAITAGLAAIGSVQVTWTFSAFTVLLYYAITNLAALRLTPGERLYPAAIALAGLLGCLFLAFWVPVPVWLTGLALVAAGLIWHAIAKRIWARARGQIARGASGGT